MIFQIEENVKLNAQFNKMLLHHRLQIKKNRNMYYDLYKEFIYLHIR